MAVAAQGEKVTAKGLVFAATPASDFICGTQQLASHEPARLHHRRGKPYGLALVPVIKVSSRTALAERWPDLIDVDAGRIATGEATIEDVGWELFRSFSTWPAAASRPGPSTGGCTTRWRCLILGRLREAFGLYI